MKKIWKVEIIYSDYDGTQWAHIGTFTDKKVAEEVKSKWEEFHINSKKMLEEPENWIPENDDWYETSTSGIVYSSTFEWSESKEYYELISKYDYLNQFDEVIITESELDTDIFIDSISSTFTDPFIKLVKEFDRDWKLNKILK